MARNSTFRQFASHRYQNGRWGTNTAWIARDIPACGLLPSGYLVSNGATDPFFYTSPIEAKSAFRRLCGSLA